MAFTRTYNAERSKEFGRPYYDVVEDDPNRAVLITGPATGDVTLSDGTVYAVDADAISIHVDHIDEIHHHIERQHERTGVLDLAAEDSPTGEPISFTHTECSHCDKKGK